ncbi:pilin [Halioxenophilus aromaticivorans]|uniref:Fimbrial major subunit PilE n=1 Tax=Halioxenophilus aromaticivorans TaxID=1306992 RepID=A0AAV3TYF1_9ALTE
MKQQAQAGFTLIELMIVVAIIGILAAVALPAYQDYTARSQVSEAVTLASGLKATVSEIYATEGTFDEADSEDKGLPAAADVKGNYVQEVEVTNGVIVALMASSGIGEQIQDKTLTLSPSTTAGSITWVCGGASKDSTNGIADKYLPAECRS